MFGEVFQFGRTDEREVGGVKEEDRPAALQILFGNLHELALMEGFSFKRENLGVQERHGTFLQMRMCFIAIE